MSGQQLIDAIKQNASLRTINNCPGVPRHLSKAVYNDWQSDNNVINLNANNIDGSMQFAGGATDTAVWSFEALGHDTSRNNGRPTLHYFAVVPWYNSENKLVFTIFMAYEDQYRLEDYIDNKNGGQLAYPFADSTNESIFRSILKTLFQIDSGWEQFFCKNVKDKVASMSVSKYPPINVATARQNVAQYNG